jgi:colanic acid/amylovoran biosynthesis glycosyltransferase
MVVTPRVPGSRSREVIDGVEIRRFRYFLRPWEGLAFGAIMPNLRSQPWRWIEVPFLVGAMVLTAIRACRTWRPDVVGAHWIVPAGLSARVVKSLIGIPYILTIHGADVYTIRNRVLQALKRRIIQGASAVAPVSMDIARRLSLPEDTVTPMGVDFREIAERIGERQPESGRILFVGRLAAKKGVDILLRALKYIPEASADIVGDGPEEDSLRSLSRELGLDDRVDFLGRLGWERLTEEFRRANVLVIPSVVAPDGDQEGTPVILGEGVAAGIPIVASRLGGLGDYLTSGETGWLVPPGDPRLLAEGIAAAMRDGERWVSMARKELKPILDSSVMVDRYLRLIESV